MKAPALFIIAGLLLVWLTVTGRLADFLGALLTPSYMEVTG